MQTAARAVTSSASSTSSWVKGSGCRKRVKTATPRVLPRAWSGTDIVEWMPYCSTLRKRTSSQVRHRSTSPEGTAATIAPPVTSDSACGEPAG